MFPERLYFPTDETTAILKGITLVNKEKIGRYEYLDGYVFKGTSVTFSEEEMEKNNSKRNCKKYKNMKIQKNKIQSDYARIDGRNGIIELLESRPVANGLELIIENCLLEFDENNVCKISGDRWVWGFVLNKTFLSDLKYGVISRHTKMGYKTIWDWFSGLRSAYVKRGWHLKSEMPRYEAIVSKYFIVL